MTLHTIACALFITAACVAAYSLASDLWRILK